MISLSICRLGIIKANQINQGTVIESACLLCQTAHYTGSTELLDLHGQPL